MAIERGTERNDGLTTERVIARDAGGTTYVDAGRGSGLGGVLIGIAVLAMVAVVAFFLLQSNRNDAIRTDAATGAAASVADSAAGAAEGVSSAANKAADAVTPAN
jgi:hypothetical protein